MQRPALKKFAKRLLQIGLPLAILAGFLYQVRNDWSTLTAHAFQWNPWLLAIAFLGFLLVELSYGLIWQSILARLGSRLDLRTSLRIYLGSEFVRYIPGNVWHVLTRILWVSKYGVTRPIAFASMTIELITKLAAGVLVFAASLFFWRDLGAISQASAGTLIVVVGAATMLGLLVVLYPPVLNALLNFALRLLKREAVVLTLRYRDILLITLAWCVSWSVAGCAFYVLLLALWPAAPLAALPICIGIYAIAWDVGFVSFITPSGLGFREATIIGLFALALPLPAGLGTIIAFLSRLVSTMAELLCVSIAYLSGVRQVRAVQQQASPGDNNGSKDEETSPAEASMSVTAEGGTHSVYMTNAEDLGNMDQAIWSVLHGQLLHQTICNPVTDTNCYSLAGISRFAIHFEPMLFVVSLFYLIWPDPRMLQIIQTLVVASGAFPAFWLARLRLRSDLAGVVMAALYLLYPMQQWAVVNDFHAVTFTAAFLFFTLYFMYTRRTIWLFVFAILAMACKEEIPVLVALFGLWSIVFQQRLRSGLALILLASAWAIVGLFVVPHIFSPTGHSLLTARYTDLGNSPLAIAKTILLHPIYILKHYVLEHNHFFYIRVLLTPAGYLPLLAPWVLVLALPTIALNLLSSYPNMYSGLYQYNAEIVPVLVFSTIEAIVLIIWVAQWCIARIHQRSQQALPAENEAVRTRRVDYWIHGSLLAVLLVFVMVNAVRADYARSPMPFAQGFHWPVRTAHTDLAQHFIDMIPPDASVSAQSALVPHISHRTDIYLFPYADNQADYIFLDVTGDIYPFFAHAYVTEVKKVLLSGNYGIMAAQDGYLLLKRGLPSPGLSPGSPFQSGENALVNLPDSFCSFVRVALQQVMNPLQVTFTSSKPPAMMNLIGYGVATPQVFSLSTSYMQVGTYWQVSAPVTLPLQAEALIVDKNGQEHLATTYFPGISWCPSTKWQPGTVVQISSGIFYLGAIPTGIAHVSIALLPLAHPSSTILDVQDRLSLHIVNAPGTVAATQGTNALQLATIQLAP